MGRGVHFGPGLFAVEYPPLKAISASAAAMSATGMILHAANEIAADGAFSQAGCIHRHRAPELLSGQALDDGL